MWKRAKRQMTGLTYCLCGSGQSFCWITLSFGMSFYATMRAYWRRVGVSFRIALRVTRSWARGYINLHGVWNHSAIPGGFHGLSTRNFGIFLGGLLFLCLRASWENGKFDGLAVKRQRGRKDRWVVSYAETHLKMQVTVNLRASQERRTGEDQILALLNYCWRDFCGCQESLAAAGPSSLTLVVLEPSKDATKCAVCPR